MKRKIDIRIRYGLNAMIGLFAIGAFSLILSYTQILPSMRTALNTKAEIQSAAGNADLVIPQNTTIDKSAYDAAAIGERFWI